MKRAGKDVDVWLGTWRKPAECLSRGTITEVYPLRDSHLSDEFAFYDTQVDGAGLTKGEFIDWLEGHYGEDPALAILVITRTDIPLAAEHVDRVHSLLQTMRL